MPLSNASRLADFGTGIGTAGAIIQVDNANQRLGVGTTAPTATLGVAGIVSATAFYGDGSNLDGVASAGLGTALSEEEFNPLTVIYQTSDTLSVGATITVDPPDATTKVAYTQYAEILLQDDADLIVADGDDFIPDILGLSTEGFSFSNTNGNGIFDTVYTDNIENAAGRGAPNFPLGITVTGISTLSGNVSIGGTLTYEDVTNVDSIGLITARSGIRIGAPGANTLISGTGSGIGIGTNSPLSELHVMQSKSGGSSHASSQLTLERDGTNYLQFMTANNGTSGLLFGDVADNDGTKIKYDHNTTNMLFETEAAERLRITTSGVEVTGLTSTTSFSVGPGLIQEKSAVPAAALTGTVNFDIVDDGMVHWHYTNASASWVVNLRGDASTTFNSLMDIGKTAVFTLYSASNNTSYYMTDFQIDGVSITERWNGGTAPSAGTGSGTDVYTFNIFKTGNAAYTVYATFSNFA